MDKLVIKFLKTNKLKKKEFERYKSLKEENKIIKYLLNTKNPYQIRIGDTIIEIEYCENDKTFKDCILNILKQKYKKG